MILIDTSVWIEYLRGNEWGEVVPEYIEQNEVVGISAVFGELLQGAKTNREIRIINEFWENLPKVFEQGLFVKAGELSRKHHLISQGVGLIDAYLLAAAIEYDLAIWTLDKKLKAAIEVVKSS